MLDFLVSLLDYPIPDSTYNSPLLSVLVVLGIREDGGWVQPQNYTSSLSAIVKVIRMLIIRQSQLEADKMSFSWKGLFNVI
ncbi:hypothetical protein B0T25DRAFT_452769 [Lasiosphaeria hispida]|uniref:Uncharacterized protein n=1 Tax=Lasiosphaeria hispida TaxID=260671 RepID=A0AAJ0MH07_9PEZI|nr:hypothetical protein B0T25DRAFT_452769 [Lasiosphaeria hispida]